jgi:ribosomal protein L18
MVDSPNVRQPADLEQLARERFDPLSDAEISLLRAAPRGEIANCGLSRRDDDPNNNPVYSDNWGSERWIRAELIRWLCVDRDAKDRVDPRGVRAHAARIRGELDLSFVVVPFFLGLLRCSLSDVLDLRFIEIPSIDLTGTCLASLNADHATVKGSISLQGLWSKGKVQLRGVRIGGNLECDGGKFQNPAKAGIVGSGIALEAPNAKVTGAVLLRNGFAAEGMVRLYGAEIGGSLDCGGGKFQNPAQADVAESGMALVAEGAKVGGGVLLRNGFAAEGIVWLLGAEIGGNLACDRGKFRNPAQAGIVGSGIALEAVNARVTGDVFLRHGFAAEGVVRLFGSEIGGNLECDGGKFRNPAQADIAESGMALNAEGAKVTGGVLLRNGFAAQGMVRLFGSEIGGNLECDGGRFQNPAQANVAESGMALNAEGAKVARAVYLRNGFAAQGQVRLYGAQIGGDLECGLGSFESLDLRNASAGAIRDDEESWPKPGRLFLDGFAYGRISGGPVTASKRLGWLARQASFTRHPYRQLAGVLREAGDDRGWASGLRRNGTEDVGRTKLDWPPPQLSAAGNDRLRLLFYKGAVGALGIGDHRVSCLRARLRGWEHSPH